MWGALDTEPAGLDKAAGHLGDILTELDTTHLGAVVPSSDVYGNDALAGKLTEFTELAHLAAKVLRDRVDLTGSALQDTATLFRGMELDNEIAIRQAGR
ncbi:hypothetical protein [Amycolatopsis thermophila]|uniref:Excreted virulence factor EspC, type VII ESX diderm n=1 Tax=Amycolatopsis thermophila TaxID=206084 RepID=A0ABU0ET75_9PSEU|nr:hypothetical protein [Amycolatopsis thermophila]MDQ0378293.1 hypothetical protein [Amycolatopsis thermophila]